MGSWDVCCGISKLPIRIDDPVVDFYLTEIVPFRDRGFICRPNDLWSPLTIQMYGTYQDYGETLADEGWHTVYVTKMLQTYVIELEQNDRHDTPITRDTIDCYTAQNAMHAGRLYVKAPTWSDYKATIGMPVTRMMVHRFVFDAMVSWGYDTLHDGRVELPRLVQQGMAMVAGMRQRAAELPDDDALRTSFMDINLYRFSQSHDAFAGSFRSTEDGDLYTPHNFKQYLNYLYNKRDAPEIAEIVTELAKFIIFRAQMDAMQFLWTPQTGSQNHAYENLSKLYRLCDSYAQQQIAAMNEGDDADDVGDLTIDEP